MMDTIKVSLKLPKEILAATKVREKELEQYIRQILAVYLYRHGKVSLGKAVEIAGLKTKWDFMHLLAEQGTPIDYTAEDAEQDLRTLQDLFK